VSEQERNAAQLSRANVQKSLDEFHRNGFVILENAVGNRSTEHVHERMLQDFKKYRNSSRLCWNQGRNSGNITQPPPTLSEYLHEDVWANRLAVEVMENIVGPKPHLSFATSNVALPRSSGRQAVHSDYYCTHLDFPIFLEVNIYLHDVDSRNGATEYWLGTHNGYSKDDHSSPTTGWIKQDIFTPRAKISPPIQPSISKGSLTIRDLRCWHAGRENQTTEPRIIMGFIFSPSWFGSHMRMTFPSSAEARLRSWSHINCVETAQFGLDGFDYLQHQQSIHLTQVPPDPKAPYVSRNALEVTPQDYWTPP
jgi:ectoine hydroxylase-related dioxygenase (phytanoyl-CoA dioxygenase family)